MKPLTLSAGTVLLAALPLLPHRCIAQESAAACLCQPRAGKLVIRYTPDIADTKPAWPATPAPIRFMSLLVLDKDQTSVVDTRAKNITCALKRDHFQVRLEPGVPNPNLLGRCGGAVTGIVTIKRNGTVVLSEREFETINCHEREKYIESITLADGDAKPALVYAGYD